MTEDQMEREIKRLRDVIDCGCNAITAAVRMGGPDIERVEATVRRMRREMLPPVVA